MLDAYESQFRDYSALYAKTKRFILLAEEVDPESRSNIAVFKEQRDAHDHIMRVVVEAGRESPKTDYIDMHFEKARGHLFRAAYDALEGIAISCKLKLVPLSDVPNGAFSAVYPEYWQQIVHFDKTHREITMARSNKDIGRDTLQNLERYEQQVDHLYKVHHEMLLRVPALEDWTRRNEREKNAEGARQLKFKWKEFLIFGAIGALIVALVKTSLERAFFGKEDVPGSQVITNQINHLQTTN
jgi:hypothetical protein